MPGLDLGPKFEEFIRKQVRSGRFADAGAVIRAGLSLLERHDCSNADHARALKASINAAFDDPAPDLAMDEVFESLETRHAQASMAAVRGA